MSRKNYDYDNKKSSAFSVFEVIVVILLALLISFMAVINLLFRVDGEATSVFGFSFYQTKAVNMTPEIPRDTVIIAKVNEIPNIIEGSVILCSIGEHTILSRVVEIGEENGSKFYVVRFDTANLNETYRVESTDVIAKAMWQPAFLTKVLAFATSLGGIITAVVLPFLIIIIFQIVKIARIKKLEKEASSLDDMDEIFAGRKDKFERKAPEKKSSAKIETKSEEPLQDKKLNEETPVRKEYRAVTALNAPEQKAEPKRQMSVDERGIADYTYVKETPKKEKSSYPLFTYDQIDSLKKNNDRTSMFVQNPEVLKDDIFGNKSTKIESEIKSVETHYEKTSVEISEEISTENEISKNYSNTIPSSIAELQNLATTKAVSSANSEEEREYFTKESAPTKNLSEEESLSVVTIPKEAVIPKESLAPAKKKKNSKTLEELMSIIDAEESKLKK